MAKLPAVAVAMAVSAATAGCAGRAGAEPTELVCIGTEPFWRLDLTDGEARFEPMEGSEATYRGVLAPVTNRSRGLAWRGSSAGSAGDDLVAFLNRTETCSDGMSDTVYPFEVFVSLPDGTALAGCCRPAVLR